MDKNRKSRAVQGPPGFWSFALSFYAREGVAPLCLRLQAEGRADVMLLIAHCYAMIRHDMPLTLPELQELRDHMADWRQRAVLPLRAIRVDLRDEVQQLPDSARQGFRDRLKQLELAAERIQADMIAHWLKGRILPPSGDDDFVQGLRDIAGPAPLPVEDITLLTRAARAA